jgi:hypothetical protein
MKGKILKLGNFEVLFDDFEILEEGTIKNTFTRNEFEELENMNGWRLPSKKEMKYICSIFRNLSIPVLTLYEVYWIEGNPVPHSRHLDDRDWDLYPALEIYGKQDYFINSNKGEKYLIKLVRSL